MRDASSYGMHLFGGGVTESHCERIFLFRMDLQRSERKGHALLGSNHEGIRVNFKGTFPPFLFALVFTNRGHTEAICMRIRFTTQGKGSKDAQLFVLALDFSLFQDEGELRRSVGVEFTANALIFVHQREVFFTGGFIHHHLERLAIDICESGQGRIRIKKKGTNAP